MLTILNMALFYLDQDKLGEAETIYRGVLEKRAVLVDSQDLIAEALLGIGEILNLKGRCADAEPLIREGLAISRKAIASNAYEISLGTSILGEALAGQKKFGEAEPLVIKGTEGLIASPRTTAGGRRRTIERVIRLYTDWGKPEKAAAWKRRHRHRGPDPPAKPISFPVGCRDCRNESRYPLYGDQPLELLPAAPKKCTFEA